MSNSSLSGLLRVQRLARREVSESPRELGVGKLSWKQGRSTIKKMKID